MSDATNPYRSPAVDSTRPEESYIPFVGLPKSLLRGFFDVRIDGPVRLVCGLLVCVSLFAAWILVITILVIIDGKAGPFHTRCLVVCTSLIAAAVPSATYLWYTRELPSSNRGDSTETVRD